MNNCQPLTILKKIYGLRLKQQLITISGQVESMVENMKKLFQQITFMNNNNKHLVIVGDFNFPGIDWENWTLSNCSLEKQFLDILREHLLIQHVTEPTIARVLNRPHVLDLVISKEDLASKVLHLSPLGNSDHSILSFDILEQTMGIDNRSCSKYNFSKGDCDEMRKDLCLNWNLLFTPYEGINVGNF